MRLVVTGFYRDQFQGITYIFFFICVSINNIPTWAPMISILDNRQSQLFFLPPGRFLFTT